MNSISYLGSYCSIRDFAKGCKVNVRYANFRKVVVVET